MDKIWKSDLPTDLVDERLVWNRLNYPDESLQTRTCKASFLFFPMFEQKTLLIDTTVPCGKATWLLIGPPLRLNTTTAGGRVLLKTRQTVPVKRLLKTTILNSSQKWMKLRLMLMNYYMI
eukprot:15348301-Ditylum_brightwellii.AAC.1